MTSYYLRHDPTLNRRVQHSADYYTLGGNIEVNYTTRATSYCSITRYKKCLRPNTSRQQRPPRRRCGISWPDASNQLDVRELYEIPARRGERLFNTATGYHTIFRTSSGPERRSGIPHRRQGGGVPSNSGTRSKAQLKGVVDSLYKYLPSCRHWYKCKSSHSAVTKVKTKERST